MTGPADRAPSRPSRVLLALTGGLLAVTLGLSGCNEVETATAEPYQPASLSEADDAGIKTVTLTKPAVEAIELLSTPVVSVGGRKVVPYDALIYDGHGDSWVYTVVDDRTYRRARVAVRDIKESSVFLSDGPAVGTRVVTRGVTEVYGAELGMEGKH
jgi:hypothetical protein